MVSEFVAHESYKTDHRSGIRFIISHVLRHPVYLVTMIIGAFSNAALAAAVPYFIGESFDALIERSTVTYPGSIFLTSLLMQAGLVVVGVMALAIIGSQLLRGGLQLMRNFSAESFAQRIERDVRDELYASLLGKSMTFHDLQPVGEIMARVTNDVRELNLMMNPGMNLLIGSGMFLIVPVFSGPLTHPTMILVPALFVIAYVTYQVGYVRRLSPAAQQVRTSFGSMNAGLAEALDGLQVVKGAAQENREIDQFNDRADAVRDRVIAQGEIEARYVPVLMLGLAIVGAFVHGVILYRLGEIDTGGIVTHTGQMFLFGFPVFSSLLSLSQAALGTASAERILSIITTETDLDQNLSGYDAPMQGNIAFENVDFGYVADGQQVLHDISFAVEAGKTIAVVGQTGSGKTTITKLINRTYDVDAGRVLVDGVDVRDWTLNALRSQISIIEQDIFLFSRTITENIRFGNSDATFEDVQEAAKKAQAHDFIMSFDDGYDTIIGQRGVTLSGGQRQRLAIARAFLTDPPVLILDDSTSAIDSATEDRIQQAIWAAAEGRTTLIITHRLSQIRWADHIAVLREGRVVAQGTHEDLLQSSESYRRIFARYEEPSASVTE